jgi:hypothetical protein
MFDQAHRMLCLITLMAAALLLVAVPAAAQTPTPITTIENAATETRLQLNVDGGLYVPGTYGPTAPNDSIPATGAGTRLMWYPAKAAFRAGRVGLNASRVDVWDAANVGDYSVALGVNTQAGSFAAMSMGNQTTASGAAATAMGTFTTASGTAATAMGQNTTASADAATAMGTGTTAGGPRSTAMGIGTTASGNLATAMGDNTTASGFGATAMGFETTASGDVAMAMGRNTFAVNNQSLSIGAFNNANRSSDNSLFVVGNGTSSSRSDALVLNNNGNLTISGDLTENSDRRLKTAITPLGDGTLEKLSRLRPMRYQFKNQRTHPSGEQLGLIAQEVQKEFPQLVSEDVGGYLSVAYPKLTAVLVKGLQEQQATIDSLTTRVRQVKTLRKRVAQLEETAGGDSLAARVPGGPLLLGLLLGGLVGAGLLWRRRA